MTSPSTDAASALWIWVYGAPAGPTTRTDPKAARAVASRRTQAVNDAARREIDMGAPRPAARPWIGLERRSKRPCITRATRCTRSRRIRARERPETPDLRLAPAGLRRSGVADVETRGATRRPGRAGGGAGART